MSKDLHFVMKKKRESFSVIKWFDMKMKNFVLKDTTEVNKPISKISLNHTFVTFYEHE
jgi:hypothetical protein